MSKYRITLYHRLHTMFKKIAIKFIQGVLWIIDKDHRKHTDITLYNDKKFTHVVPTTFKSDFGTVSNVVRTIPYNMFELKTTTKTLYSADKHRVIRDNGEAVWVEDLLVGDKIQTDNGDEEVLVCRSLGIRTHCYCLEVNTTLGNDPRNHLFYTDGVLSHNTVTTAAYVLWYVLFNSNMNVAILANKGATAREMLLRIQFSYERLPLWMQQGIKTFNKSSLHLSNESKIMTAATSRSGIRGASCVVGDTMVTLKNKETGEIENISINDAITKYKLKIDTKVTKYLFPDEVTDEWILANKPRSTRVIRKLDDSEDKRIALNAECPEGWKEIGKRAK